MIVLVHSLLVGPRTWLDVAACLCDRGNEVVVPSLLGCATAAQAVERARAAIPPGAEAVLVGHSGAGPLLPAIGGAAYVFVDSALPPPAGEALLAPPWLLDVLDKLTVEGYLPPWSQWWGDGAMEDLIPDARARAEVEAELPSLPRAYFDARVPVPDGWSRAPCGYVQLSRVCAPDAEEARARGWPVEVFDAGHLHMIIDPEAVADALERLLNRHSRS